jgi:hypothetical protein
MSILLVKPLSLAYLFTYRRRSTPSMMPVERKFTMVKEPP